MSNLIFNIAILNNNREHSDIRLYSCESTPISRIRQSDRFLIKPASGNQIIFKSASDYLRYVLCAILRAHKHYTVHSLIMLWSIDFVYHLSTIRFIEKLFNNFIKNHPNHNTKKINQRQIISSSLDSEFQDLYNLFIDYVFKNKESNLTSDEKSLVTSCFPQKVSGTLNFYESSLINFDDFKLIFKRKCFLKNDAMKQLKKINKIKKYSASNNNNHPTRITTFIVHSALPEKSPFGS